MPGVDRPQGSDDMLHEVQEWLTDQDTDGPSETGVEKPPAGDRGPDPASEMEPDSDAVFSGKLRIGDKVIDRPTVAQIIDELADFQSAEFAILARNDLTYIQAAIARVAGRRRSRRKRRSQGEAEPVVTCQLEHQDGSLEEHYEVAGGPIPFDRVAEAFRSYAAGDDAWQTEFSWSRMHL